MSPHLRGETPSGSTAVRRRLVADVSAAAAAPAVAVAVAVVVAAGAADVFDAAAARGMSAKASSRPQAAAG